MDGWIINGRSQTKLAKQKIEREKTEEKKKSQDFLLFYGVDCVYCVFGLVAKNDTSTPVSLVT